MSLRTSLRDAFTILPFITLPLALVSAWRHRRTDERARRTLAFLASIGAAVALAAVVVIVVIVL